jgi:hypothetical protein
MRPALILVSHVGRKCSRAEHHEGNHGSSMGSRVAGALLRPAIGGDFAI